MKFLSILLLFWGINTNSYAQSMIIYYADGEKSFIKTEDVDSITISENTKSELKKSLSDSLARLNSKVAELENSPIELAHGR